MEELKKKVLALTPDKAFYVYCGIPALLLIMFLLFAQLSASITGPFGIVATASSSGSQIIAGKVTASALGKTMTGDLGSTFACVMAILYVVSLIGVAVYGYKQRVGNYIFTIVPVAILFLLAVVGVSEEGERMSGSFMAWLEILIGIAWIGFAYLRGNAPIEMKK